MKYVVVSGGVLSGLGKGVTASSIGVLLKAAGLRVTSIKIDPYLNSDAGTMSPFEHGEVYVLDDGVEQRGRVLSWGAARGFRRERERERERERKKEREKERERERKRAGGKERRHAALSSSGRAVLFLSVQSSESSIKLLVLFHTSQRNKTKAVGVDSLRAPYGARRATCRPSPGAQMRRARESRAAPPSHRGTRRGQTPPTLPARAAQSLGEPSRTTLHSKFVVGRIRDVLGGLGMCYERVLPVEEGLWALGAG